MIRVYARKINGSSKQEISQNVTDMIEKEKNFMSLNKRKKIIHHYATSTLTKWFLRASRLGSHC